MAEVTLESLRGSPARLRKEAAIRAVFFTAAAASILVSALIVLSLAREAWTERSFGAIVFFLGLIGVARPTPDPATGAASSDLR